MATPRLKGVACETNFVYALTHKYFKRRMQHHMIWLVLHVSGIYITSYMYYIIIIYVYVARSVGTVDIEVAEVWWVLLVTVVR